MITENCPYCNKFLIIEEPSREMSQDWDYIVYCQDDNHRYYANYCDSYIIRMDYLSLEIKNYAIAYNMLYGWIDIFIRVNEDQRKHFHRINFDPKNISKVNNFLTNSSDFDEYISNLIFK